jgi:hypothetical protein
MGMWPYYGVLQTLVKIHNLQEVEVEREPFVLA